MTKLGFSLQPHYSLPTEEVIELLSTFGFSAVSPVWTPELDLRSLAACAAKHNMTIQSLHAPYDGVPSLWKPNTPASIRTQKNILRCVDDCSLFHIPVMVLHPWFGFIYTFSEASLDFRFFDMLVDYTRKKNVAIALENLEGEEYLDALLARYHDQPHIGFCWDSGHDHCYPHKLNYLSRFGDRLIMTHLNDNMGPREPSGLLSEYDDLHLLPYDGMIHWEQWLRKLKTAPRQAILNFELKVQSFSKAPADLLYAQLPLEAYLKEAGERARQIGVLYDRILSENK